MHRLDYLRLLLFAALVAGCAPLAGQAPTAVPARPAVLRVRTGDESLDALPFNMALDALREQGYNIEGVTIDDSSLRVAALAQDDVDISNASLQVGWSAAGEGAKIFTVLDMRATVDAVAAIPDIQTCADLDGKRVGVQSLNALTTTMLNEYIARNCPGTAPELLVLGSTSNRRAALLASEIDVSVMSVAEKQQLDLDAPDTFHNLAYFSEEFPGVQFLGIFIGPSLAEQYPETVKDFIRANLEQRRLLRDPQVLRDQAIARVGLEPDVAQALAELYVAREVWPVNGAMGHDEVQTTLEFLQAHTDLSPDLQPEDVADWSYLDAVLGEIGRQ